MRRIYRRREPGTSEVAYLCGRVALITFTAGPEHREMGELAGGLPSVAVRDTEEAYGEMIGSLVQDVTVDLRPTWVKQ
jgi:hypothetical protein